MAGRDRRSQWDLNAMLGIVGPPVVAHVVQNSVSGLPCPLLVTFPLDKPFLDLAVTPSGRHLFGIHHILHHPALVVFGGGTERVVVAFQLDPRQQRQGQLETAYPQNLRSLGGRYTVSTPAHNSRISYGADEMRASLSKWRSSPLGKLWTQTRSPTSHNSSGCVFRNSFSYFSSIAVSFC